MDRSVDDTMSCFEFACLRTKNSLMSRFFLENWEFKLHNKAKKLFKFRNYLYKKIHDNTRKLPEISKTDAYRLKQFIESKIVRVKYHNISTHIALVLYDSYDSYDS